MTDVVWITSGYPWEQEPVGGIFHRTQARALVRGGLDVTVLSPTPWAPWPLPRFRAKWRHYAEAPRVAVDEGVVVVRPRYLNVPGQPSTARPDRFIAGAAWRARGSWSGARLIHGHSAVTGLAAWRLARRADLPFVLTFHGGDMNLWPDEYPDRRADLRSAARDAGAVIAVSAALAERVRDVTGVEAVHLPIGVDHGELIAQALPRGEARRSLGLPEGRFVVLFVGNLIRPKGVRELVGALLALDHRFIGVFVGGGPEAGFGTEDPRGAGRLLYRGQLPHAEVARHLSAADVLVLPSYREGLPTVLVEAGSLGVPVIATGVGGIPELLGTDRGTILADGSSSSLAAALLHLAADLGPVEMAARRLRDHVLEAYDAGRNAARLAEIYRRVADGGVVRSA